MSWVSLSADGDSGQNDYKSVANEAFSSPTNLSSRLGSRTPQEGSHGAQAAASSGRRGPSQINSAEDAESFAQMFDSTAVHVSKVHAKSLGNNYDKPTDLGNGLKTLGVRATRYYDSRASTDADASGNGSTVTDNTFSLGSVERRTKDLDLSNNDNSFHVIGGLIVEFFQSKKRASPDGKVKLTDQDIAQLDRLAPQRVRASFVEAVRHRYTNAPMDSKNSVHVLARQCHELGLDAVYPYNPLLLGDANAPITKANNNNIGATDPNDAASNQTPAVETVEEEEPESYTTKAWTALTNLGSFSNMARKQTQPRQVGEDPPVENNTGDAPDSGASVRTRLTKMGVEMPYKENDYSSSGSTSQQHQQHSSGYSMQSETGFSRASAQKSHAGYSVQTEEAYSHVSAQKQTDEPNQHVSPDLSTRTDDSSSLPANFSGDYGNNENMAKQQLLAELHEAEGLMAESKTAEAAKFWRDHVQELQARLEALDDYGEESGSYDTHNQAVEQVSEEDNKSEQRLMAQIMNGENNYVPPNLNYHFQGAAEGTGSHDRGSQGQASVSESAGRPVAPQAFDPSLEGVPMVDVVAPADLPGGYNFEAEIEGRRFLATVPAGGVQKGETFSCYMRDLDQVGSDIPVGRWRDGLFDCLSLGLCHPVICNSLFCPLVLLGQIMSRVGFDFLGRPSLDNSINGPSTLWTIFSFWVFVNVALFCAYNVKWSRGMELSGADLGALAFVNIAYSLFVVYLTSATRGSLREKYYIRESRFHDLEDCCCATFCLPFSLAQMARHTADYSEYEGVCCNESGLPDNYEYGGTPDPRKANMTSSPIRQENKSIV